MYYSNMGMKQELSSFLQSRNKKENNLPESLTLLPDDTKTEGKCCWVLWAVWSGADFEVTGGAGLSRRLLCSVVSSRGESAAFSLGPGPHWAGSVEDTSDGPWDTGGEHLKLPPDMLTCSCWGKERDHQHVSSSFRLEHPGLILSPEWWHRASGHVKLLSGPRGKC